MEPFSSVVEKISTNQKRVKQKDYLPSGKYPVFDQGQGYIGGYTNDAENTVDCRFPAIVFGDHTKAIKLVNQPFAPGADGVKVIRPLGGLDPYWLQYALHVLVLKIRDKGYARHYQYIETSDLPIPPSAEQNRIVEKIEELFSELDKGIESLQTAREQLKIYRQAVLKHAFEGKLTEKWRRDHASELPSAEAVLERIKAEREHRYQKQLDEWKKAVKAWESSGGKGKKPTKPSKPKELPSLTRAELAELPELPGGGWWVYLGNLNADVFDGPFGSNLKTSDYVSKGIRVIRLENIGNLEFRDDNKSFITAEKYASIKRHTVTAGDIIFSSFIADGTRVVVLPDCIETAINKADCFCVRIFGEMVENQFLALFLSTQLSYRLLESKVHGATRPRINTTQLKACAVPLCSREEQYQVNQQIESRLSIVDQLERTIDESLQKAEALRQSILKEAFEGKLVPQDPNDEPASVLLERIKAEKAKRKEKQGKTKK